jgi:hypothetical protein
MPSKFCALRMAQVISPNPTDDGFTGLIHRAGRRDWVREVWALAAGEKRKDERSVTVPGPYFSGQQPSPCGHYYPDVLRLRDEKRQDGAFVRTREVKGHDHGVGAVVLKMKIG